MCGSIRSEPCYPRRGFPRGSMVKNLPASAGDAGSVPGWRRSPGVANGNPLWYSCLRNPMDRRAWWATVHGVTKKLGQNLATKQQQITKIKANFMAFSSYNKRTGLPRWLVLKNLPAGVGDIRDSGRCPGGGNGNPLWYSCLENPMDRRASWAMVHRVTKSCTWLK